MQSQNISPLNTRAFKRENNHFIITVGSVETKDSKKNIEFNDNKFDIEYGEFASYLEEVNDYLQHAMKNSLNANEHRMVELYRQHFASGHVDVHKDSQRSWIRDKSPPVESNIGWIESYVDPENSRALWDGWVAIVDKDRSKKFATLVNGSAPIVAQLPWSKDLEKDAFISPDFTSLDIVMFSGDSQPKGINIPNYGDIREKEGFKNVIFETNKPQNKSLWETVTFVTREESDLINQNSTDAYRVMVAGHELFGHGSGKLIYRQKDGKCPMAFTDPMNGESFASCYEEGGEDYKTRFGEFSSSYEECRADLSGLYLAVQKNMYAVFDYNDS